MEPVIQPGNEMMVHHILVYKCVGRVDVSVIKNMRRQSISALSQTVK